MKKNIILLIIVVFVVTGFMFWFKKSGHKPFKSEQENKAREIITKLRSNFDGLEKVSYNIQWESLNDDNGKSSFLKEVKFRRPFYYFEKGTGSRTYTYVSDGKSEQYTYDPQSDGDGFVGTSKTPAIDSVNKADGFLERFPLRILQTENPNYLGEEVMMDLNEDQVTCDVVRNDYWQIYVAKNSNTVIRADYYRDRGNTKDVITSLTDFKYSKVEIGEMEFMNFPVSFKAVVPSTEYAWKCSVLGLEVNGQTSFDDSVFKFRN